MSTLLIKALIDLFELFIDPFEALIDLLKALVDPVETRIGAGKALVDLRIEPVQSIVDRLQVIRCSHSSRHPEVLSVHDRCLP